MSVGAADHQLIANNNTVAPSLSLSGPPKGSPVFVVFPSRNPLVNVDIGNSIVTCHWSHLHSRRTMSRHILPWLFLILCLMAKFTCIQGCAKVYSTLKGLQIHRHSCSIFKSQDFSLVDVSAFLKAREEMKHLQNKQKDLAGSEVSYSVSIRNHIYLLLYSVVLLSSTIGARCRTFKHFP